MMRARSTILALVLASSAVSAACEEEQPATREMDRLPQTAIAPLGCTPATVRQCPCLHGGSGTQTCMQSGDSYGPCEACPAAPPPDQSTTAGTGAPMDVVDAGPMDTPDATTPDASTDAGDGMDGSDGGPGPTLDPIGLGPSCGVGLPTLCEPTTQKCCVRSLRTDTCIDIGASCDCDLPDCTVMEAHCDGPEDCTDGEVCCGTLVGGSRYERFECAASCDYAGTQRIACHQEDAQCPAGNECANSQLLTNVQVCIDPATIRQ